MLECLTTTVNGICDARDKSRTVVEEELQKAEIPYTSITNVKFFNNFFLNRCNAFQASEI